MLQGIAALVGFMTERNTGLWIWDAASLFETGLDREPEEKPMLIGEKVSGYSAYSPDLQTLGLHDALNGPGPQRQARSTANFAELKAIHWLCAMCHVLSLGLKSRTAPL